MSRPNQPNVTRAVAFNAALCLLAAMPPMLAMAAPMWSHARPWSEPLPAGPSLAFAQYAVDLGRVRPADELRGTFRFRNAGDKPVTITEIKPSCGCLMPRVDKKTYASGETGQITLRMQPANEEPGAKEFYCDILYTDSQPRTDRLTFRLHLPEQRLSVRPSALIVYQLSDQPTTQPIFVTDSRGHEVEILGIRTGSPFVTASMTAPADYKPVSPDLDPRAKKADGPVSALLAANVATTPASHSLKPIPESEALDGEPLGNESPAKSSAARGMNGGHSVPGDPPESESHANEKVVYITVAAQLPPGRHHAIIEIETTDPEVRFLKVPVMIQGRTTEEPHTHTQAEIPPSPSSAPLRK